jgi:hypothetical protein
VPYSETGLLADPTFRRTRAKRARAAQSTGSYHLEKVREIVERTRAQQGLPPVITDQLTLAKVADILRRQPGTTSSTETG